MIRKLKNFVEELATTEVTPNVYNQYAYEFIENEVRRNNLLIYLKQMCKHKPKIILVGEAPGYRGCRLTGVPFTSEHLLINNMTGLDLFGKEVGYRLAVEKDKLLKEATATIIWETLLKYDIISLSWNAFPFHPHKKGEPQSNRAPLKGELLMGERPLLGMIEMYNIKQVVAVGGKAEQTLNKLNIPCHKVRHPAQGGKNEFVEGMKALKEKLRQ
ncbi:MAG: uracil-DNA glycosylase-like protein [Anaerosolibacter sp.]|uniref:uracil-DNA glycosylase n=1 Tax=Anaerosolibacter sp. TaxID=1872527 RepID=UPI002603372E|nr:uracil-DNA glycosylase [Anaerosolibacter sp.]MDF2547651.1 uracil-DNA glycosylase-like protein [Anaerosolibacter sp.]